MTEENEIVTYTITKEELEKLPTSELIQLKLRLDKMKQVVTQIVRKRVQS
jgi:hypothetical protein